MEETKTETKTVTITTTSAGEQVDLTIPEVAPVKEPKSFMGGIMEDNSGGISSMRILMLMWGIGAFLVWAAAVITALWHGVFVMPTLPAEIVTILLGVTGIKSVQRFGEK